MSIFPIPTSTETYRLVVVVFNITELQKNDVHVNFRRMHELFGPGLQYKWGGGDTDAPPAAREGIQVPTSDIYD